MKAGAKYWANAFGAVGLFFALALMVDSCTKMNVEMVKEKTERIRLEQSEK